MLQPQLGTPSSSLPNSKSGFLPAGGTTGQAGMAPWAHCSLLQDNYKVTRTHRYTDTCIRVYTPVASRGDERVQFGEYQSVLELI